jgi:hypothetical protein
MTPKRRCDSCGKEAILALCESCFSYLSSFQRGLHSSLNRLTRAFFIARLGFLQKVFANGYLPREPEVRQR